MLADGNMQRIGIIVLFSSGGGGLGSLELLLMDCRLLPRANTRIFNKKGITLYENTAN